MVASRLRGKEKCGEETAFGEAVALLTAHFAATVALLVATVTTVKEEVTVKNGVAVDAAKVERESHTSRLYPCIGYGAFALFIVPGAYCGLAFARRSPEMYQFTTSTARYCAWGILWSWVVGVSAMTVVAYDGPSRRETEVKGQTDPPYKVIVHRPKDAPDRSGLKVFATYTPKRNGFLSLEVVAGEVLSGMRLESIAVYKGIITDQKSQESASDSRLNVPSALPSETRLGWMDIENARRNEPITAVLYFEPEKRVSPTEMEKLRGVIKQSTEAVYLR